MAIDHKTGTRTFSFRYALEAALVYALFGVLKLIGLNASSRFGGWLGRKVGPRIGRTKSARSNIALAMPDVSEARREELIIEMWDNLGRTICEYPHLGRFHHDIITGENKLLKLTNPDHLAGLIMADQPIIFFSAHIANWEVVPICLAPWQDRTAEVVRPANNPYVNRLIYNLRSKNVAQTQLPKGRIGTRALIKHVKRAGIVALLLDQKANDGIDATLFGQKAMSPIGGAGLALRYKCPVVPVSIKREGRRPHFTVTVGDPLPMPSADEADPVRHLVQACNDEIEKMVRANPGQWMWLHNRFRKPYVKDKWKDFVDEDGKPIR